MLRIHPISFFVLTLSLFSAAAALGLFFRKRRVEHFEPEEMSVRTLLGASLGLFGVLLGFTFSMANSRFEERRQLEITEASGLEVLWYRTSFLIEPARSKERELLRKYVPVRIQFLDAGFPGVVYEDSLRQSAELQRAMWRAADVDLTARNDPGTMQFLFALTDSITATERRTAASENRIPSLSWLILILLGVMSCLLIGVDLKSRSYLLRGLLQVAMAAALTLTYDIDTQEKASCWWDSKAWSEFSNCRMRDRSTKSKERHLDR